MKLDKKKALAAKVLKVGKERIVFVGPRLDEIKEAITKEDIRGLKKDGAILVKQIKGQRAKPKKSKSRSPGNIRKNAKDKKREYVLITRKLREFAKKMKEKGTITREQLLDIRKKIRTRQFKSKSQLKDYIGGLKK
jgi:large subunit ribosomal protein L19e